MFSWKHGALNAVRPRICLFFVRCSSSGHVVSCHHVVMFSSVIYLRRLSSHIFQNQKLSLRYKRFRAPAPRKELTGKENNWQLDPPPKLLLNNFSLAFKTITSVSKAALCHPVQVWGLEVSATLIFHVYGNSNSLVIVQNTPRNIKKRSRMNKGMRQQSSSWHLLNTKNETHS